MKSAILVDSTGTLTDNLLNHPDIYQVKLKVTFPDGTIFTDTTNKNKTIEFYEKLDSSEDLPKTSQPEPSQFIEVLDEIVEKGYDQVFFIHLSSDLSGTMQTSQMMAREYDDKFNSYFIDSRGTSVIIKNLVEQCLTLLEKNIDAKIIKEKLEWVAEKTNTYVLIEKLENLIKGGRLSKTGGFFGNLLSIKPMLVLNGTVEVTEKIRTKKRATKRIKEIIAEEYDRFDGDASIYFAHGNVEDEILTLVDYAKEKYPDNYIYHTFLTPILGTHGGPGAKGFAVVPNAKKD